MSYYIHTKGNQMSINFATATPEQLAEAGFTVKTMPAQKAPARSLLGTKSTKSKRQDQSGWARI
jgi:hypothetical protein